MRLVIGFIKQRQLRQLTLMGHSYGGGVALPITLTLLEESSAALERLVLIGSAAYPQKLPDFIRLLRYPWLGPLGLVPLPSKWIIMFGEPITTKDFPPEAADDPMLVFNLTDQVRETIQQQLYRLLVRRRSVFL